MRNFYKNVNQFQSKEERKLKYWVVKEFGQLSRVEANRLRDWNWRNIKGYLGNLAYIGQTNTNIEDINAICQLGYDIFKQGYLKNK